MEAAVVGACVGGAMKALLPKFATLLEAKYGLPTGLRKKIASMRDEMSSMNALLMKLSRVEELDEQQKDWRDKVRELSLHMEDCIDIYMDEVDCGDVEIGLKRWFKMLKARYMIAHRIEELKALVSQVSEIQGRYRELDEPPWPRDLGLVAIDPRLPALYAKANSLVGMDGPKKKLVELLSKKEDACQLKVVAIVGSGGMGKTTLAKQVYTEIKGQFECKAFVSVSQNPNMIKILSDILLGVMDPTKSSVLESCNDECRLINKLRVYLQFKRYLIVIDDLWATEAWNIIESSFVENNRGSRVITTTRIERVAQACCSCPHDHVYKIQALNDADSRRLFHRRIFLSDDACPEHLKNVSDEILKKCEGVPLAILSVASILSTHERFMLKESWETIWNHLGSHLEINLDMKWMRHVLNLGYNDLSLDLKNCLLYLGIFPEDSEIRKDDLIRRWIADGFVSGKGTYGPEELAESYFNELINRNLIQIAGFDDCGEVASCRVHDLMLEFIISKSTEENFMTVINGQRSARGTLVAHRLSLQLRNSESNNGLGNMPLTQVRSLYFWGPAQLMPSFSKFQLLRVLYLDVYDAEYKQCYLSSIDSLFQLRYLRTRGILYEEVLTRLQKLQRLKTLEIVSARTEEIVDYFVLDACRLPSTLLHLILPAAVRLVGIRRMTALHTLATLQVNLGDVECMKRLGDLSNLRELKLLSCMSDHEATCDPLLSSLCRLSGLQSLTICGSLDEDVLTLWSPPPLDLRRLHVLDCTFSTVPDWLTQFNKLRSLEVTISLLQRDGAELLARLTLLVHLRLHITTFAPKEGVVIRGAAFPYLKNFWFRFRQPCVMFEAGAMPRIQSLTVECYAHAERHTHDVHGGIEHLGSLKAYKMIAYEQEDFSTRCRYSATATSIRTTPCGAYLAGAPCFASSYPTRRVHCLSHVSTGLLDDEQDDSDHEDVGQFMLFSSSRSAHKRARLWDFWTLETAARKAINKHPGCPDISFEYV